MNQQELTVMFSDIKDFTNKVEELTPPQLSLVLADYLNAMCSVIGIHSFSLPISSFLLSFSSPLSPLSPLSSQFFTLSLHLYLLLFSRYGRSCR